MSIIMPTHLPNGARIIAIDVDAQIVLAENERKCEFVTWSIGYVGEEHDLRATSNGHYFGDDIEAARDDFEMRVNRGY